ncbi:MAG: ABC transporter permease [Candidatus Dactylopiibacterium carminicum]|uniref:ABC transporter permease n=1 Tax=Candidatus Dactylopiibacterium carminicum TaxID=857335 RepID=A0A272EVL9_9RHOO|nr:amino acid ABC transporter permease [Candidatus Dactylopiibacterium carminicum]KAF7599902.1 amino acid ABC transporter permease [Candidatus Dactylopiibacterium carminicum]PAS94159.1 MAG: ABC transporter permease [Candidatus Dactylopiibacterium carminicum]PAS96771.1 MAG: ABC transporter permease [Candidatus Dactylopiibacterium carminicum]PAS99903.1 MAG: ABC transporter permease [Candidatus Dactylopiibacterium carminicum]
MDFSFLQDDLTYLLWGTFPEGPPGGALLTLLLSAGSGLASALLGLAFGVLLVMLRGPALAALTTALGFLRAIPVLMLIFWTYFLLPILFGVDVPGVLSVMAALALVGGAYLGHGVAAGIRGVGAGQWQAGLALGFTRWGALRHLVLPQALRMMLPSFINQWVTLIKDSSLAYIVGVPELSFLATQVNARVMVHPAEIFLFIGAIYFVFCGGLDLLVYLLNRRPRRA